MIIIYENGQTYEIDEKELYDPFPKKEEKEEKEESSQELQSI